MSAERLIVLCRRANRLYHDSGHSYARVARYCHTSTAKVKQLIMTKGAWVAEREKNVSVKK